ICGCRSFECTVRRLVRRMSLSAPDVRFNADGAYRRDLSNESCQPRVGNSGPTKGVAMHRFALGFVAISSLFAQDLDRLPVKRVVLYKNGVGYFEHQGPVRNSQDVSIGFTSGQLNDVLKSLTVLDLDGGRI